MIGFLTDLSLLSLILLWIWVASVAMIVLQVVVNRGVWTPYLVVFIFTPLLYLLSLRW